MNFFKKIFYARALKAEALAQETERLCHLWLEELFSKDYRRAIQTVSPWTFEQKKRLAELLAPHLTHPEEEHRSKSALALSILGKPASVAVPSLLHALQKGGEDERINASSVLGRIAEPLEEIVPALLTALKDTNEEVRLNAAGSLARLGKNAKVAIPALLKPWKMALFKCVSMLFLYWVKLG